MKKINPKEGILSENIFDLSFFTDKLEKYHSELYGFEERTYFLWYRAFSLYEYFTIQSQEINHNYKSKYGQISADEKDLVFSVVLRLHAKSCIVAKEVLSLMRSGYPDGADARCRTLSEYVIISNFIAKHGNEVAQRYVDHRYIETYKAALEFQKYCKKLGESPFSTKEMENLQRKRDHLINLYQKPFTERFGWAAAVLDNPNPSLSELMRNVGFSYLLPLNRRSSWSIHATNAKCMMFTLSSPDEGYLLTGETNYGMADPGCSAAISLSQMNHLLIKLKDNEENQAVIDSMNDLVNKICEAFVDIQNSINTNDVKVS